jgi:serine/threonine-protein kinase
MGEVWKAEHLALKSQVALKLLKRELVTTEEATQRFEREARAAAAIRSQHVVRISDHGVHDGMPFIVMELLDGETLADRLRRVHALTPKQTLRVVTHIGRALSKAHGQGVIHRDVKPENIFITTNDDEDVAKLLDFGVVKVSSSELAAVSRTKSGAIVGTPLYMSPEQLRAKPLDHRSDLWSLAIVTFECLCGAPPFHSDSLADLIVEITREQIPAPSKLASVPAGFDAWFERATQRDPAARFESVRELIDALTPILDIAPDVSGPSPSLTRSLADAPTLAASVITNVTAKRTRRVRTATIAGAGVLLLGIVWWALPKHASSSVVAEPQGLTTAATAVTSATTTLATIAPPPSAMPIAETAATTIAVPPSPSVTTNGHITKPLASAKPAPIASATASSKPIASAPAQAVPTADNPLAF